VISWNEDKDRWLRKNRSVSFQEIIEKILAGDYIDIFENPARLEQYIFFLRLKNYTWVVPFVVKEDDTIFLKTAYPSRKLDKRYRGSHEKGNKT